MKKICWDQNCNQRNVASLTGHHRNVFRISTYLIMSYPIDHRRWKEDLLGYSSLWVGDDKLIVTEYRFRQYDICVPSQTIDPSHFRVHETEANIIGNEFTNSLKKAPLLKECSVSSGWIRKPDDFRPLSQFGIELLELTE
jgi:hypothetical protein